MLDANSREWTRVSRMRIKKKEDSPSLNCQELYRIIGKYFIGRENYYAVTLNASKNNNK